MGLIRQEISRQLDLVPESILTKPVTVVGAGAIGSWTMLALAKMGFDYLTVWDFDEVDIVNMSSQFYAVGDVEDSKVWALLDHLTIFTGKRFQGANDKYTNQALNGVVVMAVDSMRCRREIYEAQKGNLGCSWIIDARMGAETALIFTINPNDPADQEFYEKSLYTDEEATQAPCTAKSTTYCSLVLSGLVAKTVRDVLMRTAYMRNMAFSLKGNDFLAYTGGV